MRTTIFTALLAAIIVTLLAPRAHAQHVHTLRHDQTPLIFEGTLEKGDREFSNAGGYYDVYNVIAPAGYVTIQANSLEFATWVQIRVLNADGTRSDLDDVYTIRDSGASQPNILREYEFNAPTSIRLIAAADEPRDTGAYRVGITARAGPDRDQFQESMTSAYESAREATDEGRDAEAVSAYIRLKHLERQAFPIQHTRRVSTLTFLRYALVYAGNPEAAERTMLRALDEARTLLSPGSPRLAAHLSEIAQLYHNDLKDYETAERYRREALKNAPAESSIHAEASMHLVCDLVALGRMNEASEIADSVLPRLEEYIDAHPDRLVYVCGFGTALYRAGRVHDSIDVHTRLYGVAIAQTPAEIGQCTRSAYWIGEALVSKARYCEAVVWSERELAHARSDPGSDVLEIAKLLSLLGSRLNDCGRYEDAVEVIRETVVLRGRHLGVDHHLTLASINHLALALFDLGRYAEAEALLREAITVYRSHAAPDQNELASCLNNLAILLSNTGRERESVPLQHEAVAIRRQLFTEDHADLANSILNLSMALADPEEWVPLREEAVAMYQRLYDSDHIELAWALTCLARGYASDRDYGRAEVTYMKAIDMCRRMFPGDHKETASALDDLADVYRDTRRHQLAYQTYLDAAEMLERLFPAGHRNTIKPLTQAAYAASHLGRWEECNALIDRAIAMADTVRRSAGADARSRSLMEQEIGLERLASDLFLLRMLEGDHDGAFAAIERGRARALLDLFELQIEGGLEGVLATLTDRDRDRIERARAVERRLADELKLRTIDLQGSGHSDTEDLARRYREAVSYTNALLAGAVPAARHYEERDMRDAIQPGEVVLAFQWYRDVVGAVLHDERGASGALLATFNNQGRARIERLALECADFARSMRSPEDPIDDDARRALAGALVPEPLRERLARAARVIVVPDGPLTRIPMDRVLTHLAPDAAILQAHSARQYLDRRDEQEARSRARRRAGSVGDPPALLVGRPVYARHAPEISVAQAITDGSPVAQRRTRSIASALGAQHAMGAALTDLPGTEFEVRVIAHTVGAAIDPDASRTLIGTGSTVTTLRDQIRDHSPRILHIATHASPGTPERPLGAALAFTPTDDDLGFLTLDHLLREWPGVLSDCDLVVLSACDTAWGERTGDVEFALPWGFMLAGSTSVVASLWQVDDVSTALLMARFHEGRLGSFDEPRSIRKHTYAPGERMTTLDALDEAKHWIRTITHDAVDELIADLPDYVSRGTEISFNQGAPESEHPYAHPYYWAAFVLYGSPD